MQYIICIGIKQSVCLFAKVFIPLNKYRSLRYLETVTVGGSHPLDHPLLVNSIPF